MTAKPVEGRSDTRDDSGPAAGRYRIEVLPAGKNDRMVHIMDMEGNSLKYMYSRHRLAGSARALPEQAVAEDLATMTASAFARKYGLAEG